MSTIANLAVGITANTRGFRTGMSKATGAIKGFGRSITGLMGSLTGLGGMLTAGGIVYGLKKITDLAQTQYDAERKLAAVLKATGGAAGYSAAELKKFAAERQGLTNFGDEATIAMMGVLATFKEISGPIFKEAMVAIQDMSTVVGQDMKAGTIQLGKALNDPIKGVSALADVGVSFTQSQRDTIRVLQESGDIMGAQRVILAELKSEFGGAAEAMASPMTQMQNAMGDLGESIGQQLLPFVRLLATDMTKTFQSINSGAGTSAGNFGLLGESIISVADALHRVSAEALRLYIPLAKLGAWNERVRLSWWGDDETGTQKSYIKTLEKQIVDWEKTLRRLDAGESWGDTLRQRAAEIKQQMASDVNVPAFGKLPPGVLAAEIAKAGDDGASLMSRSAGSTRQFAGAALKGSSEAYSAALRHRYQQRQEDLAKKQLAETKKQTQTFEEFLAGWKDQAPEYIWIF